MGTKRKETGSWTLIVSIFKVSTELYFLPKQVCIAFFLLPFTPPLIYPRAKFRIRQRRALFFQDIRETACFRHT